MAAATGCAMVLYMGVGAVPEARLRAATAETPTPSLEGRRLRAKVVKVYDGDTVRIVAATGPRGALQQHSARLARIDAPELRSRDAAEVEAAKRSRDRLAELVSDGHLDDAHDVLVDVECGPPDKYGRLLATLYARRGAFGLRAENVNDRLVAENFAVPYDGKAKPKWEPR